MEVLWLIPIGCVLLAVLVQLALVPRAWAALFLFIVLFPKIPLAAVPGNTTPLRVDDLVIGVTLGGWVLKQAFTARARRPPASPITPFLLTYLFCAATSTLVGIGALRVSFATGLLHFTRFVEYSLLYYYFYRSIEPSELPEAIEVFRSAWLIVAGIWIIQHWTGASVPTEPVDASSFFPSFSASYDFGGYVMISTAFCYALWLDRRTRDWTTTVALLAGLYVVFNGDARSSLLGLAVAIAFDLFLRFSLRMAVGIITVGAVVPFIISSQKMVQLLDVVRGFLTTLDFDAVQRAFLSDPSIAIRLQNWQLALERWQERPVLGDGLGAFLAYVRIYDVQGTPDGWYIRALAETGLLGLFSFVALIGALLWVLLKAHREFDRPLPRAIVYAGVLGLLATATNALLIDTFVSYKIMGAFWMLMAVGTRVAVEAPGLAGAPDRASVAAPPEGPSLAPDLGSPFPGGAS